MLGYRLLFGFFCLSVPFLSFAFDCSNGAYVAISNQSSYTLQIPQGGDEGRQPDCGGDYPQTLAPNTHFTGAFVNQNTNTHINYSVMAAQGVMPAGGCYNSAKQRLSQCPASGQCYNLLGSLVNCASGLPKKVGSVEMYGRIPGQQMPPRSDCSALPNQPFYVQCQVSTKISDCPFVSQAFPFLNTGACLIIRNAS